MSTSRTSSTSAQYSSAYLPMNSHIRSGVSRNPVLPFEASIHSPRARSPSGLSGETIADDSLSVSLNLDDYIFLREMGSGAWGRVYHVVNKHTLHEYGLKLVSKEMMPISSHSFILDEQLVLRELKGLEGWAVTLHGSTHDSRYFYILMVRVSSHYQQPSETDDFYMVIEFPTKWHSEGSDSRSRTSHN